MKEKITDFYLCSCGKGKIELEKIRSGVLGSNKKGISYVGITPCPVCGSKIDINGNDLTVFFN